HRRYFGKGVTPDLQIEKAAHATEDLEILRASWSRQRFGVSHWSIAVRNRSTEVGYRDLVYETTYLDSAGRPVGTGSDRVEIVLQPGESQEAEFADGMVPASVVQAEFRLVTAEALRPIGRS